MSDNKGNFKLFAITYSERSILVKRDENRKGENPKKMNE
jgi:hypothetical protein